MDLYNRFNSLYKTVQGLFSIDHSDTPTPRPDTLPGFFILSISECSGNATRLQGFLALENGTVVSSEEKHRLEELKPLTEKLLSKILGRHIANELLVNRKSIPISEEQMEQIKKGVFNLIHTRIGSDFDKFITQGRYEDKEFMVCEDPVEEKVLDPLPVQDVSDYNYTVYSGYISFVFMTWNFTYIKPRFCLTPVSQTPRRQGLSPAVTTRCTRPASHGSSRESTWRVSVRKPHLATPGCL